MSLRRCFGAPLRARLCCVLYKTLLHSHERHREQLQITVVCKRHLPSSIQTPPTSRKRNRLRNNVCSLRKIIQRTFSYDYYVQLTPSTCRVNTNANFDDVIRIPGFFSVVCRCSVSLPSSYRSIWDVLGDLKKNFILRCATAKSGGEKTEQHLSVLVFDARFITCNTAIMDTTDYPYSPFSVPKSAQFWCG